MGGDEKLFTLAQVSEHNKPKDCWLIVNGKGRMPLILRMLGIVIALMMAQYYVGEIDVSTIPTKIKYKPPSQPHYNQDKTSEFIIKLLQFLVPLAILGLAVGVHLYTKSS